MTSDKWVIHPPPPPEEIRRLAREWDYIERKMFPYRIGGMR